MDPPRPRSGWVTALGLVAARTLSLLGLLAPLAASPGVGAQTQGGKPIPGRPQVIELRCRDGSAPWRPCRMEVERVGERWSLIVGGQRIEFRQDGRGAFTMQRDQSPWIPVQASWTPDPALCWDGVCAQGDLPLD